MSVKYIKPPALLKNTAIPGVSVEYFPCLGCAGCSFLRKESSDLWVKALFSCCDKCPGDTHRHLSLPHGSADGFTSRVICPEKVLFPWWRHGGLETWRMPSGGAGLGQAGAGHSADLTPSGSGEGAGRFLEAGAGGCGRERGQRPMGRGLLIWGRIA